MRLAERDIHIWRLGLDEARASQDRLSPVEQARAQRYQCPHARHCFVQTRAALRQVLGRYLHRPPQHIELEEGRHGKPRLAACLPRLEFNVSHSGQLALIALSRKPIGIDLEHLQPELDWRELAPACCHLDELSALLDLPEREGRIRFLRLWTLKEAYSKGRGEGLSLPLENIRLECQGRIWNVTADSAWYLHPLTLPYGYLGSVATPIETPLICLQSLDLAAGPPTRCSSSPRETALWNAP